MGTSDYMLIVVIGLFCILLFLVHRDDKRKADRRQHSLPHAGERRNQDRRRRSFATYLAWAARSQWSKFIR